MASKALQERLFAAIKDENIAEVKAAIADGADVKQLSPDGQGAIHATLHYGKPVNYTLLDVLEEAGVDFNQRNSDDQTPLDVAMQTPLPGSYAITPSGEQEPLYYAIPGQVLELFGRGAKATDHEERIAFIRAAMCAAYNQKFTVTNLPSADLASNSSKINKIKTILEESGSPYLDIPDIHAPAIDDNQRDPFFSFAKALTFTTALTEILEPERRFELLCECLSNVREPSWEEFCAHIPEDVPHAAMQLRDLKMEVERGIIGSALLRSTCPHDIDKDSSGALQTILYRDTNRDPHTSALAQLLCEGKRPEQLLELAESYQRQVIHLHSLLHLRIEELEWHPLLQGKDVEVHPDLPEAPGLHIRNLTTGPELQQEGRVLRHCVGGFAGQCITAGAHIFSIRDENGIAHSTFELSPEPYNQDIPAISVPGTDEPLYLNQHYGFDDDDPHPHDKKVVKWFVENIENGTIPLRTKHEGLGALEDNPAWQNANMLERHLFTYHSDMTHERHQEIFDIFAGKAEDGPRIRSGRRTYLFPNRFRGMAVEQFMEESGLNKQIQDSAYNAQLFGWGTITYEPETTPSWQKRIDRQAAEAPQRQSGKG